MQSDLTPEEEGARLKALLGDRSKANFAKENAIPGGASMLSQHLSGHRPINLNAAAAYARGLGVPIEAFSPRLAKAVAAAQSNVESAPQMRQRKGVPVVGEVKGGDDGYLDELQYPVGHGEGTVDYPTADPNAYALRVRGDSMHPRYRAGEFIVVEPSIAALPGDDVVVALRDGRKLLKELNWQRDGEVQLLSVNTHFGPLTLPEADIHFIQLVAGRVRRSAIAKAA